MKKLAFLISVLTASMLCAQTPQIGTKPWADLQPQNPNPTVQNGNASLGFLFDSTACGLNYTQASVKLGQRFLSSPGTLQPATLPITNLPFCAQVDKAYIWCAGVGTGAPITVTVTNPFGITMSFSMTLVGQADDICWLYPGTLTYRADVTSVINGNGNYVISGIPTSTAQGSGTDTDMNGATLMIIYEDPFATYTGSIHIDDGCAAVNSGIISHSMTGFNSCANSTSAAGFMIVVDLQSLGALMSINGSSLFSVVEDWWNFVSQPTSVLQSQASCSYTVNAGSDCFCVSVAGLYTQTNCATCVPASSALTITNPSTTAATCANNGSATIAITGGSGNYLVNWNINPLQSGLTATNLSAGTYYVSVSDSTSGVCGMITLTVPYNGPVLATSTTDVTCASMGSATATVSGGTPPYTYSWAPSGGNTASAIHLTAGIYTVTVTDSTGCIVTAIDTVQNNSVISINTNSSPDTCTTATGSAQAIVSGGSAPYAYSWMPGGQTTAVASNLAAGSYTVYITDAAGCVASSVATVSAYTLQTTVVVSGVPFPSCGDSVQLVATSNIPATFVWSPSLYLDNPNIANPVAIIFGSITYTVTATSLCGTGTGGYSFTVYPINPFDEPICVVSVDTAINKNVVFWERTNSPASGSYTIYRETTTPGNYVAIGSQPLAQFTAYTDMTANSLTGASRYKISTVDTCGFVSANSSHHRTMFLQGNPSMPSGYDLTWTAYEGLPIGNYNIYRGSNPGNLSLIASVGFTVLTYNDPAPPTGISYYMIEAINPFGSCVPSLQLLNTAAMRNTNPSVQNISGSLSNLFVTNAVGVKENDLLENSMLITPNPGNGNFQLSMSLAHAQPIQVIVYDNLGRNVYSKNENANAGMFNATMDLSSLSSGVYSVQVRTAIGFAAKRLVIE